MHKRLTALVTAASIASCSPPDTSTMGLLKAGDAKVCIASDVERTLRNQIVPKGKDASAYTISFDAATLESFDPVVAKADCHANLKIVDGQGEVVPTTGFDYSVLPSAQDPKDFIIYTALDSFREQLATAIDNQAAYQESHEAAAQAVEELHATVKPGWLIGRWVTAEWGLNACSQGPYTDFMRGGRLGISDVIGRWKLDGLNLELLGPNGAVEGNVSQADMDTFSLENVGDSTIEYRRCRNQDIAAPNGKTGAQRLEEAAADAEATRLEKAADEMDRLADEAGRDANVQ